MIPALPGASGEMVGSITSGIGGIAGGIFNFGADTAMGAVSQWVADGAVWLLDQVGKAIEATTSPDLGASWFTQHYSTMAGIGALVVLPMTLISVMQAVVRQDISMITRCVLVNLPLSLLVTGVAIEVVRLCLASVDAMCNAIAGGTNANLVNLFSSMEKWMSAPLLASGQVAAPMFVVFIVSAVVALASLVLWIELAIRSASVYIAVLFLPLAFTGMVFPATIPWCRRLIETIAALIVSKLVVVATLSLAVSAMSNADGNTSDVIEGCAMLLLATFAPFALLRMIPIVEAGAASHLEGLSRRAMAAVPVSQVRSGVQMALAAASGGGTAAVGVVGGSELATMSSKVGTSTARAGGAGPGSSGGVATTSPVAAGFGGSGGSGSTSGGSGSSAGSGQGTEFGSGRPANESSAQPGGPGAAAASTTGAGLDHQQMPRHANNIPHADRHNPHSAWELWLSAGGFDGGNNGGRDEGSNGDGR